MPKIYPTAIVHPSAQVAEDVEIGPYCLVEADVSIGPGTVLRDHVVVRRYTTLGRGNFVDAFVALGGEPQDLKFDPKTITYLRIGDDNIFREGVTISRATGQGQATVVGHKTYWMVGAHAGHDSVIEDQAILTNHAAVAGHATIGRRTILSAYAAVHQFCWVGEMVILQGNAGLSMHAPPYVMVADGVNHVVGLNLVGLRRAPDITETDRRQIREAFDLTYRRGLDRQAVLEAMDAHSEWGQAAGKFRDFVHRVDAAKKPHNRGLCTLGSAKQIQIHDQAETD
ncbi:MAG: acyl-ACP--UDP-N-acetylglucosamine O-acyltransferase [Phycisphaerae bacterium]|nr:acyl-ACP--UDP-N-acetylglucosamine O-acyltransferase [Phycisphaerae bacterium]